MLFIKTTFFLLKFNYSLKQILSPDIGCLTVNWDTHRGPGYNMDNGGAELQQQLGNYQVVPN